MTKWVDAIATTDLRDGQPVLVYLDDAPVGVALLDGAYYAFEDVCTHEGAPIVEDGAVEDGQIICPLHGARFCMKTGKALCAPAYEDIRTFPTRVSGGIVQVQID